MEQIKVVYVEDNDSVRQNLAERLKTEPSVDLIGVAKTGPEAIELIEKTDPQVVVSEIVLSGCDGFSVIEKVKAKGLNPRFLIVSSLSSEAFISKALDMGADYFMIKPVDIDGLISRIGEVAKIGQQQTGAVMQRANPKQKQLEEKISNIFITVGIPAHIKGYQFLREAIKLAVKQPEIINSITKELYPRVADQFSTSPSKVERAIRHAIEVAWNRGKIENINAVFGIKVYSNNEKPTNGEFIALVADKMLIEG